jgi:hypothetical protein
VTNITLRQLAPQNLEEMVVVRGQEGMPTVFSRPPSMSTRAKRAIACSLVPGHFRIFQQFSFFFLVLLRTVSYRIVSPSESQAVSAVPSTAIHVAPERHLSPLLPPARPDLVLLNSMWCGPSTGTAFYSITDLDTSLCKSIPQVAVRHYARGYVKLGSTSS